MKARLLLALLIFLSLIRSAYAVQSTITEAEGYSCMGDDKSRKQTEQAAMNDAKKNAAEYTSTYIKSETKVNNYALQEDLVTAYANAEVTVIEELEKGWYKDPSAGDCYRTRIKAEVIPDQQAMERLAMASAGTGTVESFNVPVAPPPVPDSGMYTPQGAPIPPDVVVVPSGPAYVYMVPTMPGIYFYNGFWFRYYEGYWFRAPIYNRGWIIVSPVVVPRVVVNVPPEYPRYLPPNYHRINPNDLNQHWQEWNRNHEWHKYDWFRNERKPQVREERNALIQQEREEHRVRSRTISQTPGNQYIWQQHARPRPQVEYKRPEARQQFQGDHKPVRQNVKKEKQKKEKAAKHKKEKKREKAKEEHREGR